MKNNPFTPGFQRRLLAMLLQVPETYSRYNGVWDPTYFDDPIHRKIVHAYMHIQRVGTEQPNQLSVSQELLKDYDLNKDLPMDVTALIEELGVLYTIPVENIDYSLNEVKAWSQQHALMQAVEESVGLIQGGKPEQFVALFQRVQNVGDDVRLAGEDFYRTDPQLPDEIIPGLLYRKSIGVLSGKSKSYKSWNLIAMCIAVGMGKSWLGFPPL
jgi:replicative DNA helicase